MKRLRLVIALLLAAVPLAAPRAQPVVNAPVAASVPKDVAFGRQVALLRADIATADELVAVREMGQAARHAAFPLEEIYGVIREDLRLAKVPPFDAALRTYAAAVKRGDMKAYAKAHAAVTAGIERAEAAARPAGDAAPHYVLSVALAVLRTAAEEYEDAATPTGGVRTIDYQAVRGMLVEAGRLIESVAEPLLQKNAAAVSALRNGVVLARAPFATLSAPRLRTIEPAALAARVKALEAAARPLL